MVRWSISHHRYDGPATSIATKPEMTVIQTFRIDARGRSIGILAGWPER